LQSENQKVSVEDSSSGEEEQGIDLREIQRANLEAARRSAEGTKVNEPEVVRKAGEIDYFALYKPDTPFVWEPRVRDLFEFCRQDSSKKAAEAHVNSLQEPSDLQLPNPSLDRSAAKHFREAAKGYDKLKKAQAYAALNLDSKLIEYQRTTLNLVKLSYEAAKQMAAQDVSLADLLKLNSSAISLLYKLNADLVADRRESIAFYLDRDIELARNLPMPEANGYLFDKVFVEAAEAEQKKEQAMHQSQTAIPTGPGEGRRHDGSSRYKPYSHRRGLDNYGGGRNGGRAGPRKLWPPRSNAMPSRNEGELAVFMGSW
jgi:hypothetical protein